MFKLELKLEGYEQIKNAQAIFKAGLLKGLSDAHKLVVRDAMKKAPARKGHLRRSIPLNSKYDITGITLGSNLKYARIQELGGIIRPRIKDYLKFEIGGKTIFTKKPVRIKAQPYLRPALEENVGKIENLLRQRIIESWESR